MSSVITRTREALAAKTSELPRKSALVGLDGFVDKLVSVVGQRHGRGDQFTPLPTLEDFGQRVVEAAGKSANFELFPKIEKLGGNGPIMANALLGAGCMTRYIGMLGEPLHPVFGPFAEATSAISLGQPGVTLALEFDDGKLLLGEMADFDHLSYGRILERVGEGAFFDLLSRADLVALVNWTMIPGMTEIFADLLTKTLPNLPPKEDGRLFFFDLADPAKRPASELATALRTITRFQNFGRAVLGLNLSEARQVAGVLDLPIAEDAPLDLKQLAQRIRNALEIHAVVVHPREGAAAATRDQSGEVTGPFCAQPRFSTGGGDHFNAGFCLGLLLNLQIDEALTLAVATSGQYIRTGISPSLSASQSFLDRWDRGEL